MRPRLPGRQCHRHIRAANHSQIPPPQPFTRRSLPLNWGYYSGVDVHRIAETGDESSVQALVPHIAFANITNEDCRQFTTRGSQHAFMLLQLAVEMLMRQNTELQTALCSARQAPPVQAPAPPPVSPEAAILRRDLEARNALIDNLTAQLDAAEHEKNSMIAETQSLRARIKKAVGGRGRGRDATPTWDDSTTPTRRPEADPSSESEDSSGWT